MSFESTDFREEVLDLENELDVKFVTEFLKPLDFDYDPEKVDYTMIVYNLNDQIIGTGSYKGEVLKYVAVAPEFRDSPAFSRIVTHLMDADLNEHKQLFVFTKPENAVYFEGLGFSLIAKREPLFCVLEFGYKSIKDYLNYLNSIKVETVSDKVAAVVVNCNPFTLGHLHLIEKAASENEIVYLFVVEEDRSAFNFDLRWELIEKGITHLNNVVMVRGDKYVVSGGIFPSYFLKHERIDKIARNQAELDVTIFGKYFVPLLGIKKRYIGTETYCKTTAAYNIAMQKLLPDYGVEVEEIKRISVGLASCINNGNENFISASKVRKAIKENRLNEILNFLPVSTKEFLLSEESNEIKNKIRNSDSRH